MSLEKLFVSAVFISLISQEVTGTQQVYLVAENGIHVPLVFAEETTPFTLFKTIRQMFVQSTRIFTLYGNCSELMFIQDTLSTEAQSYSYNKELTLTGTDELCSLAYKNSYLSLEILNTTRSVGLYNIPSRTCDSAFRRGEWNSWNILRDISHSLHWERFCMLYTAEYGLCADIISTGMWDSSHKSTTFRIQLNNKDLLKKQLCDCITYSRQNFKDFIIIADHHTVMSIFHEMDKLSSEYQGLGQTARILVFTQTVDKDVLLTDIPDSLLNIAFLQLLHDELEDTEDNSTYSITSLVTYTHSREFKTSIAWDEEYKIHRNDEVFPVSTYMLNNVHFKVTTKEWDPFTVKTVHNGAITYTGFCMDLLDELAYRLNFSYTLSEPLDGQWGAVRNRSWTGMIGELVRKEADVMIGAISAQKEREDVMDFTYPIFHDSSSMILKRSVSVYDLWSKIFRPFHWTTLLLLVGSIVVIGLVLSLVEAFNPIYGDGQKSYFSRWDTCVWYLLAALLREGGERTSGGQAGRTIIATWWLFTIVIMAMYTGDLIASFSVTTSTLPFNTLKGLTQQSTYKWGLEEGAYISMLFPASSNEDYKQVWKGVKRFQQEDKSLNSSNITLHLDRVKEGNYVFLNDRSMLLLQAEKDCENLAVLRETFLTLQFAVGLHQDSTYREMFSEQIMFYHEVGLVSALTRKWWPKNVTCDRQSQKTETQPIALHDMQGLYLVGLAVIVFSGIILICENISFRVTKNKSNNRG